MSGEAVMAIVIASLVVYSIGFGVAGALIDRTKYDNGKHPPWQLIAGIWPAVAVFWIPLKIGARLAAFGAWLVRRPKLPRAEVHRG